MRWKKEGGVENWSPDCRSRQEMKRYVREEESIFDFISMTYSISCNVTQNVRKKKMRKNQDMRAFEGCFLSFLSVFLAIVFQFYSKEKGDSFDFSFERNEHRKCSGNKTTTRDNLCVIHMMSCSTVVCHSTLKEFSTRTESTRTNRRICSFPFNLKRS
jgi:hypothetical protein